MLKRNLSQAERADPYRLYQASVQDPLAEVAFIKSTFVALRGRAPGYLREDFCGTAAVTAAWVLDDAQGRAVGIDCDPRPLHWARQHQLAGCSPQQSSRLKLLQRDVQTLILEPVDTAIALNFSYWCFHARTQMRDYFAHVLKGLVADGVFFLDAFGGYDAFRELSEERPIADQDLSFTYVWQQERYNPVDSRLDCHIHFAFEDGSRLDRAFSYQWRLWTLVEIQELLLEAGFSKVIVYGQGWDENDEADGVFVPVRAMDADAGWICYLAALK